MSNYHGILFLTTWEREGRGRKALSRLILGKHRIGVGLAFSSIRRGDGVDDGLSLLVADFCEGRQFHTIIWPPDWTHVGNNQLHFEDGFDHCYEPCARSWNHA